jgi:esterase/lipase superfamily enzyme
MDTTTVFFATNRKKDGTGQFGFGATGVPIDTPATYAVADVQGASLDDAGSGTISSIRDPSSGDFKQAIKANIASAGRNLLVFIHGANNSFEDAIKRAAFNRKWFADSGKPAADTTIIAFTWPSIDNFFKPPHAPLEAYKADQAQAGKSNVHLAQFLKIIAQLRTAMPNRKIFLLAHSMGNFALAGAVQGAFDDHASNFIFDQTFLAAADEIADTFEHNARLSNLRQLSDRISIYYSQRDFLMILSRSVNGNDRLGFNGPTNKTDAKKYPEAKFRMLDCTNVLDFFPLIGEETHQYYRRSKRVRTDITDCMVDQPHPGGGNIILQTQMAGIDPGPTVV